METRISFTRPKVTPDDSTRLAPPDRGAKLRAARARTLQACQQCLVHAPAHQRGLPAQSESRKIGWLRRQGGLLGLLLSTDCAEKS